MPKAPTLDEVDIKILKAISEAGAEITCKEISEKTGINVRKIAAKMRKLTKMGLVERIEKGKYKITEEGKAKIS